MHNRFIQMLGNLIGPHTDGKTRQDIEALIKDMQVERDAGPSPETTPAAATPAVVEDDPQHELVFDSVDEADAAAKSQLAAAPAAQPVSAAPPNEAFVHPIPPVGSALLAATGDGSAPMVNGQPVSQEASAATPDAAADAPVEQETLADGPAQPVAPEELADAPSAGTAGLT